MAKRTDYYKQLGEKIREVRRKAKVSQKAIAEKLKIDQALISKFENQGEKLPAERIDEILDMLGYELGLVKKNSNVSLKQRLQQIKQAFEETLEEMDKTLGSGASAKEDEHHTAENSDLNYVEG